MPGVAEVHDLHVWTVTSGLESLSAHVVLDGRRAEGDVLADVRRRIGDRFGIEHCTIQLEPTQFEEPETPVQLNVRRPASAPWRPRR